MGFYISRDLPGIKSTDYKSFSQKIFCTNFTCIKERDRTRFYGNGGQEGSGKKQLFWIQPFGRSRPKEGKTYLFNGIETKNPTTTTEHQPLSALGISLKSTSWLLANPSQLFKVTSLGQSFYVHGVKDSLAHCCSTPLTRLLGRAGSNLGLMGEGLANRRPRCHFSAGRKDTVPWADSTKVCIKGGKLSSCGTTETRTLLNSSLPLLVVLSREA